MNHNRKQNPQYYQRQSFKEINEEMRRSGHYTFWQLLAMSSWYTILSAAGVCVLLVGILSAIYLLPNPKQIDTSFSPNLAYEIRIYTISSNKKEGSAIYLDLHNRNGKKLRSKIFEQWYCLSASLDWIDEKTISINGITMDVLGDEVHLEEQMYPSSNTNAFCHN